MRPHFPLKPFGKNIQHFAPFLPVGWQTQRLPVLFSRRPRDLATLLAGQTHFNIPTMWPLNPSKKASRPQK
jgi:hypothetical protein